MRVELHCFHPEPEFKGYLMEEIPHDGNNSASFKCPKCGKETLMFIKWETPK